MSTFVGENSVLPQYRQTAAFHGEDWGRTLRVRSGTGASRQSRSVAKWVRLHYLRYKCCGRGLRVSANSLFGGKSD